MRNLLLTTLSVVILASIVKILGLWIIVILLVIALVVLGSYTNVVRSDLKFYEDITDGGDPDWIDSLDSEPKRHTKRDANGRFTK